MLRMVPLTCCAMVCVWSLGGYACKGANERTRPAEREPSERMHRTEAPDPSAAGSQSGEEKRVSETDSNGPSSNQGEGADSKGATATGKKEAESPIDRPSSSRPREVSSFDVSGLHWGSVSRNHRVLFSIPVEPRRELDRRTVAKESWRAPYRPEDWPEPYSDMETVDVLTPEGPIRAEIVEVDISSERSEKTHYGLKTEPVEGSGLKGREFDVLVSPGGTMGADATLEPVESDGTNLPDDWDEFIRSELALETTQEPRVVADPEGDGSFGVLFRAHSDPPPIFYRWVYRQDGGELAVTTVETYEYE